MIRDTLLCQKTPAREMPTFDQSEAPYVVLLYCSCAAFTLRLSVPKTCGQRIHHYSRNSAAHNEVTRLKQCIFPWPVTAASTIGRLCGLHVSTPTSPLQVRNWLSKTLSFIIISSHPLFPFRHDPLADQGATSMDYPSRLRNPLAM